MPTGVKKRNLVAQVILAIVTLGIYAVYWFYQTTWELKNLAADESARPGLWTFLMFIPFVHLYVLYKHAELFERVSTEKFQRWLLWVIWLVFAPAVWFIVQTELNTKATY